MKRYTQISNREREEISKGLYCREEVTEIAKKIGRSPSSVYREIARHRHRGAYSSVRADRRALANKARNRKKIKLDTYPELRAYVIHKLELRWSPDQIAKR